MEAEPAKQIDGPLISSPEQNTEAILNLICQKDDVNWKSIIHDLIKSEQMNPWDIDVSLLTNRYINIVKKMQEHDFRISGKMILAAAILLKIKSKRLVGQDMEELDRLFAARNDDETEEFYEELGYEHMQDILAGDASDEKPELIPRTPQPRVRKVSVYDLVNALEQALEVKKRRVLNSIPDSIDIPKKSANINRSIRDLYQKILELFKYQKKMTFSNLLPENCSKETKVFTFIPLLHLTTTRKISLNQKEHFGEIDILLRSERIVGKESSGKENTI